jgi:hypothetical protein
MTMPKLIDADKLLEYLNGNPDGYISDVCYEGLKERIESGTFDPTPPVQPDIKPGDKVRNRIYGLGEVDMVANRGCRKYAMVQFAEDYTGMWAEELEVIK